MKSLKILQQLLQDASDSTGASTKRDWVTIQSRFEHESLSFLTIVLPEFCQWFEKSIDEGQVGTSIFSIFRKKGGKVRSVLPCFLHGLTSLVFDSVSGRILPDPDVNAVFFVRQICLFMKKIKAIPTPPRVSAALVKTWETDFSLKTSDRRMFFSVVDRLCIDTVVSRMLSTFEIEGGLPKHGPGATVEKIHGNSKFKNRDYLRRWDQVIGWEELYGLNTIHQFDSDSVLSPKDEKPIRITVVPKTMKSPRVIGVEPVAMQFAQQLVARRLVDAVERSPFGRSVNFQSQERNRQAALLSSKTQEFATMDLSEASDRVSCKLVREIFRTRPDILRQLFAVRSSRAKFPNGAVAFLRKYASMGSATTFPVEAIVFYALVVSACAQLHFSSRNRKVSCPSTERDVPSARKDGWGFKKKEVNNLLASLNLVADKILVFGDDIIVPAYACQYVTSYLESFGLKVNLKKTFSKGSFRESCGMDAFRGYDVTPVYVRQNLDGDRTSPEWFSATVSLSNQLFLRGMWKTANAVSGLLPNLPMVAKTSPGLGFWHYTNSYQPTRYSVRDACWLVRTKCVTSVKVSDEISDEDALLKFFLDSQEDHGIRLKTPEALAKAIDHLKKSPKRYSTKLVTKWVTPY